MPADAEAIRRQLPVLEEMGFGISDFGHDTFMVDALPVHLQAGSPLVILSGIAKALEESGATARATLRETRYRPKRLNGWSKISQKPKCPTPARTEDRR